MTAERARGTRTGRGGRGQVDGEQAGLLVPSNMHVSCAELPTNLPAPPIAHAGRCSIEKQTSTTSRSGLAIDEELDAAVREEQTYEAALRLRSEIGVRTPTSG